MKKSLLIPIAVLAIGCDDPLAAFLLPVPDFPVEASLADHRTAPLQEESAYDGLREIARRVDQSDDWDFVFFITEAGQPQLRPFGAVTTRVTDSGLKPFDGTFEELERAPTDGYEHETPLSISVGDVLAVVTRRDGAVPSRCRHFAKMRIIELDMTENTVRFEFLSNPNCEDRVLIPGKKGTL